MAARKYTHIKSESEWSYAEYLYLIHEEKQDMDAGVCVCALVAQSYLTLCDPMDCSLPGSSIRGIFQARILEWIDISFSRGSSWPRDQTQVSHIAGKHFTIWASRGAVIMNWIFHLDQYTCIWVWLLNSLRKYNTNFNDFNDFQAGHLTVETVCANVFEIFSLKGRLCLMTYASERQF